MPARSGTSTSCTLPPISSLRCSRSALQRPRRPTESVDRAFPGAGATAGLPALRNYDEAHGRGLCTGRGAPPRAPRRPARSAPAPPGRRHVPRDRRRHVQARKPARACRRGERIQAPAHRHRRTADAVRARRARAGEAGHGRVSVAHAPRCRARLRSARGAVRSRRGRGRRSRRHRSAPGDAGSDGVRARIVAAGDAERRRVERNLHDGAAAARHRRPSPPPAPARLETAPAEAPDSSSRRRPSWRWRWRRSASSCGVCTHVLLSDRGLEPALARLAERALLPVEIVETPSERLPPAVEARRTTSSPRRSRTPPSTARPRG